MSTYDQDRTMQEETREGSLSPVEEVMAPARTLEVVAAEIRALTATALNTIVEIGRRMTEAKAMLPHGEFGRWIRENMGYSSSTASNFMRIFEAYADPQGSLFGAEVNCQTFGNLNYSKALALLEVPAEEREEFVQENDVEGMSTRELQAAIKERDEARRREAEAQEEARVAEESRRKMEDDVRHANERLEGLQQELEELRSRPIDVAVEKQGDEEAVARAVAETEERLRGELEKARADVKKAREALEKEKQRGKDQAAQAEEKVKAAQDGEKRAVQGLERAQAEAERLRKELSASGNKAVVEFGVHFAAAQGELNRMLECMEELEQAGDGENREKLGRAYRALLESFREERKE